MGKYFKDLWLGVSTVLVGMRITLKHVFTPTVTVQYPHEKLEMNERTRARLVNYEDECGVCFSCVRACPVNIINVQGIRAGKDEDLGMLPDGKPKKMHLTEFTIDFSKCVYCGLCVDVCDTKSLRWEAPQEDCTFDREGMFKSFCSITPERLAELKEQEAARKAAKAKAAAGKPKPGGKPIGKPGSKPAVKSGVKPTEKPKPKAAGDDQPETKDEPKPAKNESAEKKTDVTDKKEPEPKQDSSEKKEDQA